MQYLFYSIYDLFEKNAYKHARIAIKLALLDLY
jgi:hypothetical protein